jgi:2'-5' RNA ligase
VSPFPAQMQDHWSQQPGVDPRRARLMWFMLLGDHPQVAELARLGQARLGGIPGLDLVPREWLHMTTLIAGFADEITPDQVEDMRGQAHTLLALTPPVKITLGRVLYHPRAVMLAARPPQALEPVLRAVQQATHVATGQEGELHHEPWTPHITLAYGNAARPAGPVIEALGRELPAQQVTISSISLISQAPEQLWTWHLVAEVPFGTGLRFHAETLAPDLDC